MSNETQNTEIEVSRPEYKAFFRVNLSNDFFPGGSLGFLNMRDMVGYINVLTGTGGFDDVIDVFDKHDENHISFNTTHLDANGNPAELFSQIEVCADGYSWMQTMYPPHEVIGTTGAELYNGKLHPTSDMIEILSASNTTLVAYKGTRVDRESYSPFRYNVVANPSGAKTREPMAMLSWITGVLQRYNSAEFHFVGALDGCAGFSAKDLVTIIQSVSANPQNYKVFIHDEGCSSIVPYGPERDAELNKLRAAGVIVV
jgi:nicotinamidase-related amidase